jgi:hypothetical protein
MRSDDHDALSCSSSQRTSLRGSDPDGHVLQVPRPPYGGAGVLYTHLRSDGRELDYGGYSDEAPRRPILGAVGNR